MLNKLRDRAAKLLADTTSCTLATTGPAGVQVSIVRCAGQGSNLYLLLPNSSDHLFNLEVEPEVALATERWHLRGTARLRSRRNDLFEADQFPWHVVVQVRPLRLHIQPDSGNEQAVTIDFEIQ